MKQGMTNHPASLCLLLPLMIVTRSFPVGAFESQTVPPAPPAMLPSSDSVQPTPTHVPTEPPTPKDLSYLTLIFLAIIPISLVLICITCVSCWCCRIAQKRWRRSRGYRLGGRDTPHGADGADVKMWEGGQGEGASGVSDEQKQNPLLLPIPTYPPRVLKELVTPLLSSQEEHTGNGEQEMELRQQDETGRNRYERVVQHLWTDSPSSAGGSKPVTVIHLTAKSRAGQPVAQPPPTPLKPCLVQKGRPSGRSNASSVSYIYPGGSRTCSNVSSNQSHKVSSHSYESLDCQRKPGTVNSLSKRQVRIIVPEDEQGSDSREVACTSMQALYDGVVESGAGMRPFDDVIDEEDGDLLMKQGSPVAGNGHRSASGAGSGSTLKHIPRDTIHIIRFLGEGYFSTVYEGAWRLPLRDVKVAVKKANDHLEEKEKVKFLQEASVIGQFNHPHIVRLYGVIAEDVSTGEPCAIVLEYLPHGDLKQHLRQMKKVITQENSREVCRKLLQFSRQIASGMDYLSKKKFVHRDLAARNILLDRNYVCKIGDFGLSRDLEEENYYRTGGGVIAWKWTAPEALKYGKFSTGSDVWSFGCVLYEMWSLGRTPLADVEQSELVHMLHRAYRMPPPAGCPRGMYKLMIECWHPERSKRPSFLELYCSLMQGEDSLLQPSSFAHSQLLGSDELTESAEMYMDLQQLYYNQH